MGTDVRRTSPGQDCSQYGLCGCIANVRRSTVDPIPAARTRKDEMSRTNAALPDEAERGQNPVHGSCRKPACAARPGHPKPHSDREELVPVAVPVFVNSDMAAAKGLIGTSIMLEPLNRSAARVQAPEQVAQTLGAMVAGWNER